MDMMISIKDVGLLLIFIALIVLIIYLVMMVKKLTTTLEQTNSVLEDVKVMTDVAQKRTTQIDDAMDDVLGSVSSFSRSIKGEESTRQSISSIAKSAASFINIIKGKDKD